MSRCGCFLRPFRLCRPRRSGREFRQVLFRSDRVRSDRVRSDRESARTESARTERDPLGTRTECELLLSQLEDLERPVRLDHVRPPGQRGEGELPSLLGVPIHVDDRRAAHFLLIDKKDGFTQEDEEIAVALADAAAMAMAMANSRQPDAGSQERWLEAEAEVSRIPSGMVGLREAAGRITQALRDVSGADYVGIVLLDPAQPDLATLESANGLGMERMTGSRFPVQHIAPAVRLIRSGHAVVSEDFPGQKGYVRPPEWMEAFADIGLGMVMPLLAPEEIVGVTFLGWKIGSPVETVAARDAHHVESFVNSAALALRQVKLLRERSDQVVFHERDRIVRDLRDGVIDRLFAIGTCLHSAAGLTARPEVAGGSTRRSTTSITPTGRSSRRYSDSTTGRCDRLSTREYCARSMPPVLGLDSRPDWSWRGVIDDVPPELERVLELVVRDALAQVTDREAVTDVEVVLHVTDEQLVLAVTDNGADVGRDEETAARRRSLHTSAEHLGGSFEVRATKAGMTKVVWKAPLG
ncbi:MAG: GAF domain-containing protein [Actinopolymorphaceae bacterium]